MGKKMPKIRRPRGALGQIMVVERRRLGLSISDVASRAGMVPSRVHAYECGDLPPGPISMPRLLRAINLPEEFSCFLTALARIDLKLAKEAKAIEGLRSELGRPARFLVHEGLALAKKTRELREKDAGA